ncbi:hypothetical protein EDF28_3588 [Curtobacterium sp. PhB137]|nr:hypothetical protein EDF28_3588 [Curtobacterium sp. PhB137]
MHDTVDRVVLATAALAGLIAVVLQGAHALTAALLVLLTYQYAQDGYPACPNPPGYQKIHV